MKTTLEKGQDSKATSMKFSYQVEEEKPKLVTKKDTREHLIPHYGIKMAELLGLPQKFITKAY